MDTDHDALADPLRDLGALSRDALVTTAQARRLGLGPSQLRALVRAGLIRRVIRGWYAVPPDPLATPPWAGVTPFETDRNVHRLLVTALIRSFEGRVAASHQSTLVLCGVPLWQSDLRSAHVCRASDEFSRRRSRAVVHPACGAPLTEIAGLPSVPIATAIVQVGLVLGRSARRHPLESLIAADYALHEELVTREELDVALEEHVGVPGIVAVRDLLAHADGRHESVGETRLMHNLRILGYSLEAQQEVRVHGRSYRVDGRLQGHAVFVEFDGLGKYLSGVDSGPPDELAARRRLAAEKRRQDEITEVTQAEFVRFTWDQLDHLAEMDRRIQEAIRRSERRRGA